MLDSLIIFFTVLYKYVIINTQNSLEIAYYLILLVIIALSVTSIYGKIIKRQIPDLGNLPVTAIPAALFILAVTVLSKDANYLLPFLIAVTFSYDRREEFIKRFFTSSVMCFTGQLVLYWLGLAGNNATIRIAADGTVAIRNSIGFGSPNEGLCFFLPIFLSGYLIIKDKKSKIVFYSAILAALAYIYYMTRSRTGALLILLFIVISFFDLDKLGKHKFIINICKIMYFMLSAFSYILAMRFGRPSDNAINKIMTGRPYIWSLYMSHGIKLIGTGRKIAVPDSQILPQFGTSFDNYFLYTLHCYGLIVFVCIGILYFIMIQKMEKNGQFNMILAVMAYLLYGCTEANTLIASTNFTLIYLYMSFINPDCFAMVRPHKTK
ncbi:MAG: hypothetical protein LBC56_00230 [Oscillospiraceae bacterium]|jgi:hypothetical protein|nr:hypothetical protein [Oscillospiraceae bacterium]